MARVVRRAELRKLLKRWMILPLGLGAAAVAGWVLLAGSSGLPGSESLHGHAEIDQESREQLRQILRRADEDGQ
jgi:hypothetical protein